MGYVSLSPTLLLPGSAALDPKRGPFPRNYSTQLGPRNADKSRDCPREVRFEGEGKVKGTEVRKKPVTFLGSSAKGIGDLSVHVKTRRRSSRVAIISHKGNFSALSRLSVRTILLILSLLSPLLTHAVAGDLLVSSATDVLRYDGVTGAFVNQFIGSASGGLVFGPERDLYVSKETTSEVLRFDGETGASLGVFVSSGSGGLSGPRGLVFGPDGNLYVVSRDSDQVLRYNGTTGAFIDAFAAGGGLRPTPGNGFRHGRESLRNQSRYGPGSSIQWVDGCLH